MIFTLFEFALNIPKKIFWLSFGQFTFDQYNEDDDNEHHYLFCLVYDWEDGGRWELELFFIPIIEYSDEE